MKLKIILLSAIYLLSVANRTEAVVTLEKMQEFFTQHAPDEYKSGLLVGEINPIVYGDFVQEIFELIESNNPLDEKTGLTPLDIAVQVKKGEWIEAVFNYLNSPDIRTLRSLEQCLTFAIDNRKELVISPKWTQALINQPLNNDGDTGIIIAARAERRDLFEQLKGLGADPEKKNIAGENAFTFILEFMSE